MKSFVKYILSLTLLTVFALPAVAQLPEKQFRVMDATSEEHARLELVDGRVNPIIDEFKGSDLQELKVYIMFTTGADSLLAYSRRGNTKMLNDYIKYYEERNYMIKPDAQGTFHLEQANWIAEELYRNFKPLIDYWISKNPDLNPYSIALVIRHDSKGGQFEKHDIDAVIDNKSEDPRACIYYKGNIQLEETVTSAKQKQGKIRKSNIVKGSFLPISENIAAIGPSNMRLVIDRVVRPCTFKEDLQRVQRDFRDNDAAQSIALRLLGHSADADSIYRQIPFVFAGVDFQKSLYRRTAGVLLRDTMEYFRQLTNVQLAAQMGVRDYKIVESDTIVFELDHSIWFEAYNYPDFKDIRDRLQNYANRQRVQLPANGGERLEAGESRYYTLEVDSALFHTLERYVDRGHIIAQRQRRTSSDQIIQGWIPASAIVTPNPSDSVLYQVSNSSVLKLATEKFLEMELAGHATVISRNNKDSIYRVRVNSQQWIDEFEHVFDNDTASLKKVNIFLSDKPSKDREATYNWEFKMPDEQKYYKMEHVNYLHDFIHVDTTTTEVCPCDRATPLMFLSIGAGAATFDCPPFLPYNGLVEDWRPIPSNREPHAVDRSAHLQFAVGKSNIDRHLGDNDSLLEYMSVTVEDILFMDDETGSAHRRIDSIVIRGISSPEGQYASNKSLALARAQNFGAWIRNEVARYNGQQPRVISSADVAPWDSVASFFYQKDSVEHAELIARIREACATHNTYEAIQQAIGFRKDPLFEEALAGLRMTEVRFYYQDVVDPTEDDVLKTYAHRNQWEQMDAFHYWTLLTSQRVPKEEKLEVARFLLDFKKDRVKNFIRNTRATVTGTRKFEDYFDLVLPMAATLLVTDSINLKVFNTDILRPFIDPNHSSGRGNQVYTKVEQGETKSWKWINQDYILYNQVLSLLGKNDQESLREGEVLIQFLNNSNPSEAFINRYNPKSLGDYLKCYTSDFLTNADLANSIKQSSMVNLYIVDMDIAHQLLQQEGGTYANGQERDCLKEMFDNLAKLKEEGEKIPSYYAASLYFTAVTEMHYSMAFGDADWKREHFPKAVSALVQLFKSDEKGTFISRLQGDAYVRGVYATPKKMSEGVDLYLDAVEQYIKEQIQ